MLFREGDPADTFYLVRHGSVALETFVPARGAVTIETVEAGEVSAGRGSSPPYRWHFDARALDRRARHRVRRRLPARQVRRGPARSATTLMSRFAQVLIERLQWTRLRLLDVYGDGRVAELDRRRRR